MTDSFFTPTCMPGDADASSLETLFEDCPPQFKDPSNRWHRLATKMRFYRGANATDWKIRNLETLDTMMAWLTAMTVIPEDEDKPTSVKQKAVSAWILWSMLEEVPEFVRPTVSATVRAAHG